MAYPPRVPVTLPLQREVIYFVTFNVADRQKVLANAPAFAAFQFAINKFTSWTIIAGVMMPDHIHLLAAPADRDGRIGNFTGAIKRWIRQQARHQWSWQPGSFDRLLRHDESASEKWAYMRENPVRAGLVKRWQDWPYRIGIDE